jgi:hypothetical protein
LVLIPTIFIGQTKQTQSIQGEANQTTFELKNFKYSEMNASGLSLIILGASGYYFENENAKITRFVLHRLDSNITEKLSSNVATRTIPTLNVDGNVIYERSDGVVLKSQNAVYNEVSKKLIAAPVYAKIEVKE